MTARRMLTVLAGWMGAVTSFFGGLAGIATWAMATDYWTQSNLPFLSIGTCVFSLILQIVGGVILGIILFWAIWPDVKEVFAKNIEQSKRTRKNI